MSTASFESRCTVHVSRLLTDWRMHASSPCPVDARGGRADRSRVECQMRSIVGNCPHTFGSDLSAAGARLRPCFEKYWFRKAEHTSRSGPWALDCSCSIYCSRKGSQRSLMLAAGATNESSTSGEPSQKAEDPILQYVVLRKDLYTDLKWPLGSVVAQACHASTAALWSSRQEALTQEYCAPANLDNMHKVVLEVKGETQLQNLALKLREAGINHRLWIEQPENIATSLATAPYNKSGVQHLFKKLKLCSN